MKTNAMAHEELQALIGRALIEPGFCRDLLNGRRDACLAEFPLTTEEHHAARAIEATSLQDFARQLDGWVQYRRMRPEVTRFTTQYAQRLAAAA